MMYTFPKYKFRKKHGIKHALNMLLKPFMILSATGKDSHWWDWEELKEVDTKINQLCVGTRHPQKRKYKNSPLLGKYNLQGLTDLYITLRTLDEVAVLEPVNFKEEWSLVIRGNYGTSEYIMCKFLHKGRVKTLLDGNKHFLGITKNGKYIPVKLVERCSRQKHKKILFV